VTDQQFEDLCIVVGSCVIWALLLAAGTYLIVTEHYGWAWIPFVLVGSGFRRSKRCDCVHAQNHSPTNGEKT
jgi:hypothetical protein